MRMTNAVSNEIEEADVNWNTVPCSHPAYVHTSPCIQYQHQLDILCTLNHSSGEVSETVGQVRAGLSWQSCHRGQLLEWYTVLELTLKV